MAACDMHGVAGMRFNESRLQLLLGVRAGAYIPGARLGRPCEQSRQCEGSECEPHEVLPNRSGALRAPASPEVSFGREGSAVKPPLGQRLLEKRATSESRSRASLGWRAATAPPTTDMAKAANGCSRARSAILSGNCCASCACASA